MTPKERNNESLFDTIEVEIRKLEVLQSKVILPLNETTSDKLAIRKLRLKK
mgnify:CR=1 FL=1